MNTLKWIQRAGAGLVLAGSLFAAAPAQAQVVVEFPGPEVIATTPPVYFEGRPAYWWHDHWYYRDGGRWSYYHDEPGYLHDYRYHHVGGGHVYYEGRGGWGGRGWHGRR